MYFDISIAYYLYGQRADSRLQEQAFKLLDDSEKARFNKFKAVRAAEQFLIGRLLAKTSLAERLQIPIQECRFELSDNGKPYLQGTAEIGFSIAHTEGAVAVAVANTDIGIDLEQVDRFKKKNIVNENFFSRTIVQNIHQLTSDDKSTPLFTENKLAATYWTAIEAIVKLEDTSIFSERKKFNLLMNEEGNYRRGRDISLLSWNVNSALVGSIAIKNSENKNICLDYKDFLSAQYKLLESSAISANQHVVFANQ